MKPRGAPWLKPTFKIITISSGRAPWMGEEVTPTQEPMLAVKMHEEVAILESRSSQGPVSGDYREYPPMLANSWSGFNMLYKRIKGTLSRLITMVIVFIRFHFLRIGFWDRFQMAFPWLINGGDPNHLQVLGWSSKYQPGNRAVKIRLRKFVLPSV